MASNLVALIPDRVLFLLHHGCDVTGPHGPGKRFLCYCAKQINISQPFLIILFREAKPVDLEARGFLFLEKTLPGDSEQENPPHVLYLRRTPGDWSDTEQAGHTRLGVWWSVGGRCV